MKIEDAVSFLQRGDLNQAIRVTDAILKGNPNHFDALHIRAVAQFHARNLEAALRDIRAAVAISRDFAEALNTHGIILRALGRSDEALAAFTAALARKPGYKEALYNIANCHRDAGRFDDAVRFYDQALRQDPNFLAALNNKGSTLRQQGRNDAALACFDAVLAKAPRFAEAHSNRGDALAALGDHAAAIASYDVALSLNPVFPACHCSRANALRALNRQSEAMRGYDAALAQDSRLAPALVGKAALLRDMDRLEDAISCLRSALAIDPGSVEAVFNLGHALSETFRLNEALDCYDAVIRLRPDDAEAFRVRGNLLGMLRRYDDALASYDRSISLAPDHAEAHGNRADLLQKLERFDEALAERAQSLRMIAAGRGSAERAAALWTKLLSVDCIPSVYRSQAELVSVRTHVEDTLDWLVTASQDMPELDEAGRQVAQQAIQKLTAFYLAYHQRNDRDIMRKLSQVASRLLSIRPAEPVERPRGRERIRIGVASANLRNHNGANWSYQWLAHLPRGDFEIFTYGFEALQDELSRRFAALGRHRRLIWTALDQEGILRTMRGDDLDVLMLPDVGMTSVSRFLSLHRIAPCQFTAWGHPVTTGSPEMDYYLSSDLMEPEGAEVHYTEQLVRMPNIALFLDDPDIARPATDRRDFGLPDGRVLYGCLQSLFKYLPRDDAIWPQIAHEVPSALFVFIEGQNAHMTATLRARLDEVFARHGLDASKHVVFLPRLTNLDFERLMLSMDVCIDSVGWSGGNTSLQCIASGIPLATLPGEFMRGRHTAAMFRMIGAEALITASKDDYVGQLVRMGRDEGCRKHCSELLLGNHHKLYRDRSFIAAFDRFLKEAAAR